MTEFSFIKRVVRDIHKDYECSESAQILIDRYIHETADKSVGSELYIEKVELGAYSDKSMRKLMRTAKFLEWAHEEIYFKLKEFWSLYNGSELKRLKVYRAIEVDFDFIGVARESSQVKAGLYWTYDYKYAIPYNSSFENGDTYIFHAEVNVNSINWFKTFLLYVCNVYGEDEKEIRLFDSRKLHNLSIEKNDNILFHDFRYKKCIS